MMFIAGVIFGFIINIFIFLVVTHKRADIERSIKQVQSKVQKKGSILEQESEEVQQWVNSLNIE